MKAARSNGDSDSDQKVPRFGDERDTVIRRAEQGGLKWALVSQLDRQVIKVELPNGGRKTRAILIDSESANLYSTIDFASTVALGSYEAVWQKDSGIIESQLDTERGLAFSRLSRLPEVTIQRPTQDPLFDFSEDDGSDASDSLTGRVGNEWVLRLSDAEAEISIEISPPGASIMALGGRNLLRRGYGRPTLKILGFKPRDHDEALQRLIDMSSAFFFELDLKRNIALRLSRSRQALLNEGRATIRRTPSPLSVPKKKYSAEAVSLYTYGRQALGMPLLQFLAFYQCIEYYFPQYWNAELIDRLRRAISDPRFDPDQDSHIGRLVGIGANRPRGGSSEREQLRTTIDACVDDADIEEFLGENEVRKEALLAKNRLRGVPPLAPLDRNNKLTHQVAARIYELRCRVVHAKEEGGAAGGTQDVLLPFSAEAELLGSDVALARFVAQKAIIAGRRGNQW